MKHQEINGHGRPVLIACKPQYETLQGSGKMIAIPTRLGFFGERTYFDDVDMFSVSCGVLEYDAETANRGFKYHYPQFIDVDNKELRQHLKSTKVSQFFRNLANDLMCSIPLQ